LAEVGVRAFQPEVRGELVAAKHLEAEVLVVGEPLVHHRLAGAGAGVPAGGLGGLGVEGQRAEGRCEDGSDKQVVLGHGVKLLSIMGESLMLEVESADAVQTSVCETRCSIRGLAEARIRRTGTAATAPA